MSVVYLVCIPWKYIRSFYGREDEEVKEERRKKMVLVLVLRVPPVLPPKRRFASDTRFIAKYLLRGCRSKGLGQLCSILLGNVCERESSWDVG